MDDSKTVSCITDSISRGIRIALDDPPKAAPNSVKKQVEIWLEKVRAGAARDGPFSLPGTGHVGKNCGMLVGCAHNCDDCQHRWPAMISCKRWTSPCCAPTRVVQVAMAANRKLGHVGATLPEGVQLRRSSINVPPARWAYMMSEKGWARGLTQMRSRAARIAAQVGYLGGTLVFHPYRDTEERWRFDQVGPHFHVTGWARPSLAPWGRTEYRESDGWTVSHRPERWQPGRLYRKLAYDLTHVGTAPNRPALTWWGMCHHRKNPLPADLQAEVDALHSGAVAVCPQCDSINTRTTVATIEELMEWAIPGHRIPNGVRVVSQHRFNLATCDDCGGVALEAIPDSNLGPLPGTEPEEPRWLREKR